MSELLKYERICISLEFEKASEAAKQTHSINRTTVFFYKHEAVDAQINLCHFEGIMIAWHQKYRAIKIIRHVPFAFLMLNI